MTMAEEIGSKAAGEPTKPDPTEAAHPAVLDTAGSNPTEPADPGAPQAPRPTPTPPGATVPPRNATDHPPPPTAPVAGAFSFADEKRDDQFNLKPRDDRSAPIPEDQRKISGEVYEARNILKLLQEQRAFKKRDSAYHEFINRTVQAAYVGCVSPNVDTTLAAAALEQIRADIVRRKGRHIIYRYLLCLGSWAFGGIVAAAAIIIVSKLFSGLVSLTGYGWVIMGSMIGAWLSVAAGRREVSFDGIPDYLNYGYEPFIRMLFVGVLATVFALFLELKVLSVVVANFDLASFPTNAGLALAIGVVAGIGERALSVQLIARAQNVLSPATR